MIPTGDERRALEEREQTLYRQLYRQASAFLISPMNDRALFQGPDDYTGAMRSTCADLHALQKRLHGRQ